jgi:hypothetical protein
LPAVRQIFDRNNAKVMADSMKAPSPTTFSILSMLYLLLCGAPIHAQSTPDIASPFTLTLRQALRDGRFPKGTLSLIVRLTNTSDAWLREDSCEAGGSFNKLIVSRDGVPVSEPDWIRKRREDAEAGMAKGRLCNDSNPAATLA